MRLNFTFTVPKISSSLQVELENYALELASQVKSIARALNFKVASSVQMRAKLVEQIGAVIGQCARRAIQSDE